MSGYAPLIRRILRDSPIGPAPILTLEDPMALPRGRVYLVPPPQPDQSPACDVLQVIEVGGEEKHGDDEDEDAVEIELVLD